MTLSILPATERKCPRKLCESMAETVNEWGGKFARRPWNRFDPTLCPWWMVPSPELIHHRYGKYYFDWADKERTGMLCGFYVEKGLAPMVAKVYPSKKGRRLIMTDQWAWKNVIKGLNDGSFTAALGEVAAAFPGVIELRVSGGYVEDPRLFDPYNPQYGRDEYRMEWNRTNDTVSVRKAIRDARVLKTLNKAKKLSEWIDVMNEFNADPWLWLDVFIAAKLTIKTDAMNDAQPEVVWPERQVAEELLRPFIPWAK